MIFESDIINQPVLARWNVEPFQTFAGTLKVGVVAMHPSGVERVKFSVNGGAYSSGVTAVAYNSDSKTYEHFTTLTASDYSDGPVTVDAYAVAADGSSRRLDQITVNANSGSTLAVATYFIDVVNGTDGPGDGSTGSPFQTMLYAYTTVYTARAAFTTQRMDGVTFKMRAGDYTLGSVNHNVNINANLYRPVTFKPDDGVARSAVVVTATALNGFGDRQGFNTGIVKVENLTFNVPFNTRTNTTHSLITKDCDFVGDDRLTRDFTFANWAAIYHVRPRITDAKRAVQAATLARGARLERIGESAYHDCAGAIVGCGCVDLDDLGGSTLHPDLYQFTGSPVGGAVVKGLIAREIATVAVRMQPSAYDVGLADMDVRHTGAVSFWEMERPYYNIYLRHPRADSTLSGASGTFIARSFVVENEDLSSTPTNSGIEIVTSPQQDITVTPSGGSALDQFDSDDIGTVEEGNALTQDYTVANPGDATLNIGEVELIDPDTGLVSTDWDVTVDPSGTIAASDDATLTIRLKDTAAVGDHAVRVILYNDAWGFYEFEATATVTAAEAEDTTAPTITARTIPSGGTTIVLTADEAITAGAGGSGGLTLTMSGGAVTATYASGSGTTTITYDLSRTVYDDETGTATYTQPGDGWEDAAGNDLATFTTQAVTNNSTVTEEEEATPRRRRRRIIILRRKRRR